MGLLAKEYDAGKCSQVTPIIRVQKGFFNDMTGLMMTPIMQPSLEKLLAQLGKRCDYQPHAQVTPGYIILNVGCYQ